MFERFTERARRSVVLGQEELRLLQHSYYGPEHLLLGLIREGGGGAARALNALDITLDAVRGQVTETMGRGSFTSSGHIPFTPGAKHALERSLPESLASGQAHIGTGHILLGLIDDDTGAGAQILVRLGAGLDAVREQVLLVLPDEDTDDPPRGHAGRPGNDAT